MKSRFSFSQKIFVAASAVISATTLLSGRCSAQPYIAADYATNATYAGGWTTNQNGGYGFTAWSFDGTFDSTGTNAPVEEVMTFDHSSPSDALGTAWTLFNPPGPGYGWIAVAGRGFAALQPYQTFEVVMENPTNVNYDGGYEVQLDSGTDNIYSNSPTSYSTTVPQVTAYTYGYFGQLGEWLVGDYYGNSYAGLYVSNTAPAGVKMDFTILPAGNYQLTLTPLNNPTNAQTVIGTLKNPGLPTDWVEFEFFNAPTNTIGGEFYVSSMTVVGPALNIQLAGTNAVLTWQNMSNYLSPYNMDLEASADLGPTAVWNAVTNSPAIVNGQNVVTNPIAGTRQFYRLYYP
ncbi:MAG TPA: hypothetical protein VMA35_13080 [Candidatus Sulfopaludibacter sp.]|nr:hypothetical protein [Candidatus Sulfopaludibacter sp.]